VRAVTSNRWTSRDDPSAFPARGLDGRSMTKDELIATAPWAILGLAALLGIAWLVGVHKKDAMLDASHPREAFAAVKKAAGPRMQARKIKIGRDEMAVMAVDPDMSPWRYVSGGGRADHSGHWYYAPNIYEQSWRVSYWTVFGHDWYHVSGPTPEGIGQKNEGPAFELRPDDVLDPPELLRKAAPDPDLPHSSCSLTLIVAARWWTVCLDTQGDPLLIFLQSR
jgi:hypothetical protein